VTDVTPDSKPEALSRFRYRIVLDVFSDEEANPDMPSLNINAFAHELVRLWEDEYQPAPIWEGGHPRDPIVMVLRSAELVGEVEP
jgi:hypothetical protein